MSEEFIKYVLPEHQWTKEKIIEQVLRNQAYFNDIVKFPENLLQQLKVSDLKWFFLQDTGDTIRKYDDKYHKFELVKLQAVPRSPAQSLGEERLNELYDIIYDKSKEIKTITATDYNTKEYFEYPISKLNKNLQNITFNEKTMISLGKNKKVFVEIKSNTDDRNHLSYFDKRVLYAIANLHRLGRSEFTTNDIFLQMYGIIDKLYTATQKQKKEIDKSIEFLSSLYISIDMTETIINDNRKIEKFLRYGYEFNNEKYEIYGKMLPIITKKAITRVNQLNVYSLASTIPVFDYADIINQTFYIHSECILLSPKSKTNTIIQTFLIEWIISYCKMTYNQQNIATFSIWCEDLMKKCSLDFQNYTEKSRTKKKIKEILENFSCIIESYDIQYDQHIKKTKIYISRDKIIHNQEEELHVINDMVTDSIQYDYTLFDSLIDDSDLQSF